MANILLTAKCTRACPYCFAEKEMADSTPSDILSWENMVFLADFLKASGEQSVSLLGGEPTIHPQFVDFVLYLVERRFRVLVFTNALMSPARFDEIRRHLGKLDLDAVTYVVNLNNPVQTEPLPGEQEKIEAFLKEMGPWCMPGFNIYRTDFDLDFVFDTVARHGMKRRLRLGITHPVPGVDSAYIRPDQIKTVVDRLMTYAPRFERTRIRPQLDCGFVLCQFDDAQLGWMARWVPDTRFYCSTALDISPDLSIYGCFPMSEFHRRSILEFSSVREAVEYYENLRREIRVERAGIYEECDGCVHREERRCDGGGVCQSLKSMVDEAPVRMPVIENELPKADLHV